MLVNHQERRPIVELLYFLEIGERLAHKCAAAQAAMAPTSKMRQFLEGQAKQEALHATIFQTAGRWIAPRYRNRPSTLQPFEEYTTLLIDTLKRKDFYESILAEQVILESLGEAILSKIEDGLQNRNAPFRRLRKILLYQEAAHHGFGERVLEQAMANDILTKKELDEKAVPYLELSRAMVLGLKDLFEEIEEDPREYLAIQQQYLPPWLVTTTQDAYAVHHHPSL